MTHNVLSRWGPAGFLAHCRGVASLYRARRDMAEGLARKYLGDDGLAEWTTPVAGMFLYIKVRSFIHSFFHLFVPPLPTM